MLKIVNLGKKYDHDWLFQHLSFSLKEKETVAILGKSGSGKTTLFDIINGSISPEEGEVYLGGKQITNSPGHLGYVTQNPLLLPYKTLFQNAILPLVIQKTDTKEKREWVKTCFSQCELAGCMDQYPHQVSGGMSQRVALLRGILAAKNNVLLLDEPFSALDEETKKQMILWFQEIKQTLSLTTLFITHNKEEAKVLAQRILTFQPGTSTLQEDRLF